MLHHAPSDEYNGDMNTSSEPWRAPLAELRAALLRLHKTLLDAERLTYEIEHGPIKSSGDYLQLLINNERFTWLQPFTNLIVTIDETEESKEAVQPEAVEALWERAKLLTAEPAAGSPLGKLLASSGEVKTALGEVVRVRSGRVTL